jgi:hypothetical protein
MALLGTEEASITCSPKLIADLDFWKLGGGVIMTWISPAVFLFSVVFRRFAVRSNPWRVSWSGA